MNDKRSELAYRLALSLADLAKAGEVLADAREASKEAETAFFTAVDFSAFPQGATCVRADVHSSTTHTLVITRFGNEVTAKLHKLHSLWSFPWGTVGAEEA